MKEIISKDSEKIVYKENDTIYIYDKITGDILSISSYKHGEVCTTKSDGTKSYDSSWFNKLSWFPEDEQEKVRQAKADHDFYCRNGCSNPAKRYLDDISVKNTDMADELTGVIEQSLKNIEVTETNNSIINNSNNDYIIVNGKHYKKPSGSCSTSIVNGTVKINGKQVKSIEEIEEEQGDLAKLKNLDLDFPDNLRFPANASVRDPIDKDKELVLFDTVEYKGHKLPKCPGMLTNGKGQITNIVETKDSLFCNGYEFKNGKWIKTFKAKLKTLFK